MAVGTSALANQAIGKTASGANKGSVLPGYGDVYLEALKRLGGYTPENDKLANIAANATLGGSGLTQSDISKIVGNGLSYSGGYNPNTGFAKSQYDELGNAFGRENASSFLGGATAQVAAPKLDFSMPEVDSISWDDALQRALEMYTPAYNTAVQRQDKQTSEQRARLPQMLAARGYLRGGKLEAGDNAITQEQAMARTELDNAFETQKQQAASAIFEGEQARANSMLNALISLQANKNNAAMSEWQTKYGAALQKERDAQNALLELARMAMQGEQFDKTYGLQEEKFDFDKETAAKAAERQARIDSFNPQMDPRYKDLYFQELQAGIAAKNRSNIGGGGSGGGSGSSAKEPTSIDQRATQQALAQVWQYNSPQEAITAYKYYGPDMAASGVDLGKVWDEIKKRWPDNEDPLRTLLRP